MNLKKGSEHTGRAVILECLNPGSTLLSSWTLAFARVTKVVRMATPLIILLSVFSGCKRNPTDRLVDPNQAGSVPQVSGTFSIYEDRLKTGGGLFFAPGGENQSIDLVDQSTPRRGLAQIRYSWNGKRVFNHEANVFQHDFAGFSLSITPDSTGLDAATAKNLSGVGYTSLKFFVRGALDANTILRVEGPGANDSSQTRAKVEITPSQLGADWQEFSISIPAGDFNTVKIFASFTLIYSQPPRSSIPGNGGVIYIDGVRYE